MITAAIGALVTVATTYVAAKLTGQEYTWKDAGFVAGAGAINAVPEVGPLFAGLIIGGYAVYTNLNNVSMPEAVVIGIVSGVCTADGISNLVRVANTEISMSVADVVFGSGFNAVSAAACKAIQENSMNRMGIITGSISGLGKRISVKTQKAVRKSVKRKKS